ncbi:MAG TPA: hypothetical protein HPP51_05500, partial [Planctomycetes bacterium]|nr:hypothetical protein [Planctomycetota bacterium]
GSVMTRGYNNIFSPAAAADYAVYVDSSDGTVYHDLKNNCVYSANASSALTNEAYNSDRSAGFDLMDSITQDPEFTDAANADFTVRNALLLQGGDPDAAGNATQVGMVQRKYRPSISGRRQTSNLAALSIFR